MIVKANKDGFFGGHFVKAGTIFSVDRSELGKWMTPQKPANRPRKKRVPKIVPVSSAELNSEEGA